MLTRTFTIIKPNAVRDGNSGKIIDMLITEGFRIAGLKMVYLSRNDASRFYSIHAGKPFFENLVEFMTSGPVIVGVLEKEDAVAALRQLAGDTDPATAGERTIRKLYGETITRNAIHASDSDDNARMEWEQFFIPSEIIHTV